MPFSPLSDRNRVLAPTDHLTTPESPTPPPFPPPSAPPQDTHIAPEECGVYKKGKAELALCVEIVVQWGNDMQQVSEWRPGLYTPHKRYALGTRRFHPLTLDKGPAVIVFRTPSVILALIDASTPNPPPNLGERVPGEPWGGGRVRPSGQASDGRQAPLLLAGLGPGLDLHLLLQPAADHGRR